MELMTMLSTLEQELENAKNVPLSSKKMIDIDEFLTIIDNMKIAIPDEIKQSRLVLERETYILEDAKRNAALIVSEAEKTAKAMIDEHEIVRKASEKGEEIMEAARSNAQEIRDGAMAYARDMLKNLEAGVAQSLETIRENLQEFEK